MKRRTALLAVGAAVVAAVAVVLLVCWLRTPAEDDFDYAAAFERPPAAATPGAAVDVPALAGRSAAEVEALLGAPSDCEDALHSRRCRYAQSPVEIVYIGGRADWFTVRTGGQDLPLAAESLARFGLPVTEPAQQTERENVWRDLAGLKEVRMVGDEYGVSYVRIKALTP